jgi:negative regulator of genetic competence, sporulation and motility
MKRTADISSAYGMWDHLIDPEKDDINVEAARYFLSLDFRKADHRRLAVLAEKANDGTLSEAEAAEYDKHIMYGQLLALLRAKSLRALHKAGLPD